MAEAQATLPFVMAGAREVLAKGAEHVERLIVAIEDAVATNPGLAIDLAYSLVDTCCKTILEDRGYAVNDSWDVPRILKETLNRLPIAPPGAAKPAEAAEAVKKAVNGLLTTIQGLCELRRLEGFASHGKDGYTLQGGYVQGMLAARSADAIFNFLFRCHRGLPSPEEGRRLIYENCSMFNDWIDEQNEVVRVFGFEYRPSEVLYGVDQEAYRDMLMDFQSQDEGETTDKEGEKPE